MLGGLPNNTEEEMQRSQNQEEQSEKVWHVEQITCNTIEVQLSRELTQSNLKQSGITRQL